MIPEGKQVSIEYTLTLDNGSVADSNVGKEPLVYEQGKGQILPALEQELGKLDAGVEHAVTLSAEQGYGPVNPKAFQEVKPDVVPEDAREQGKLLVARDQSGNENRVRIHEVHPDRIVLDFNHPLAGERLHFDVKIVSVT